MKLLPPAPLAQINGGRDKIEDPRRMSGDICCLGLDRIKKCPAQAQRLLRLGRSAVELHPFPSVLGDKTGAGFNGRANNLIFDLRHVQTTKK